MRDEIVRSLAFMAGLAIGLNWQKLRDFSISCYKKVGEEVGQMWFGREPVEPPLDEKFLQVIEENPGMTLPEIAKKLEVAFVRLAGISRMFVNNEIIKKEEGHYFLVSPSKNLIGGITNG